VTKPKFPDWWLASLLMTLKVPIGVPQPSLPEAIGETKATRPSCIKQAACSVRLMITSVF
jgi:hypothetical protein